MNPTIYYSNYYFIYHIEKLREERNLVYNYRVCNFNFPIYLLGFPSFFLPDLHYHLLSFPLSDITLFTPFSFMPLLSNTFLCYRPQNIIIFILYFAIPFKIIEEVKGKEICNHILFHNYLHTYCMRFLQMLQ